MNLKKTEKEIEIFPFNQQKRVKPQVLFFTLSAQPALVLFFTLISSSLFIGLFFFSPLFFGLLSVGTSIFSLLWQSNHSTMHEMFFLGCLHINKINKNILASNFQWKEREAITLLWTGHGNCIGLMKTPEHTSAAKESSFFFTWLMVDSFTNGHFQRHTWLWLNKPVSKISLQTLY